MHLREPYEGWLVGCDGELQADSPGTWFSLRPLRSKLQPLYKAHQLLQ